MENKNKILIGLLVLIIGILIGYNYWPEKAAAPIEQAAPTEPVLAVETLISHFDIYSDRFDFYIKANEPFIVTNLKSNSAKLWIREVNFEDGKEYSQSLKSVILDPDRSQSTDPKYWRESITETTLTLEPGLYEIKDIFSGVTKMVEVTAEGVKG